MEGRQEVTWNSWNTFKEEIRLQLGEIDEQGGARTKLMKINQGNRDATEYWNEFRLVVSQTGMDDVTMSYNLIRGFKSTLQDAWGMDGSDFQDPQFIANWAIKKETKMTAIQHMRHGVREKSASTTTPRNRGGTFKPNNNQGDPMDLDTTRRRPAFNISTEDEQ